MSDEQLVETLRPRKPKGTEEIKRDCLQDAELSYRARGVLAYLLSMPDGWRTNSQQIADKGKEGRDAIRTALVELEAAGYLARRRKYLGDGAWRWVWAYADSQAELLELLAEKFPEGTRTATVRPRTVKPPKGPQAKPQTGKPVGAGQDANPAGPTDSDGLAEPLPATTAFLGGGNLGGRNLGDVESNLEIYPPNPPQGGGSEVAPGRCEPHGRSSCRKCGTSPRAQAWAEKAEADAAVEAAERIGKACRMCVADGPARGGGTRWLRALPGTQVVVTPYTPCDHETPHAEFMAGLAAADTATPPPPVKAAVPVSSAEARARAREIGLARCKSSRPAADRVQDQRAEVSA